MYRKTRKETNLKIPDTQERLFCACLQVSAAVYKRLDLLGRYKDRGKVHPRTSYESPEREKMYSTTLSLTLALFEAGG
jgi:hypothetical protein